MEFRIQSRTDDLGTYWWVENKMMLFWWQYEPGIFYQKAAAERRMDELIRLHLND